MKALFNIPYGLYVLTAKDEKDNGCIINTLQQVTSNPTRISITVNKDNYTTKMIEQTGEFNVSILDKTVTFDLIKNFGFASGKEVNKFENFKDYELAKNGVVYITQHTNSYLSAKVVSQTDVGTHITFVADVTEDVVLSPWQYNALKEEHYTPVASRQVYIDYYDKPRYKGLNIQYVEDDPWLVKYRKMLPKYLEKGYKVFPCMSEAQSLTANMSYGYFS